MEVKVVIKNIENLKTQTGIREEKDQGEVISRKLITRISFECDAKPEDMANVLHLIAGEAPVHIIIGSPQALMEVGKKELAFAEA